LVWSRKGTYAPSMSLGTVEDCKASAVAMMKIGKTHDGFMAMTQSQKATSFNVMAGSTTKMPNQTSKVRGAVEINHNVLK
jgi:hypothetical protein